MNVQEYAIQDYSFNLIPKNTMANSAYRRYLEYAKDNLSGEEYHIVLSNPKPFSDITMLAYAHAHTCEVFHVPAFEMEIQASKLLLHYASVVEDFPHERFIGRNTWLCSNAFLFYLDLLEKEGI